MTLPPPYLVSAGSEPLLPVPSLHSYPVDHPDLLEVCHRHSYRLGHVGDGLGLGNTTGEFGWMVQCILSLALTLPVMGGHTVKHCGS